MKQLTISHIINNHNNGKLTYIGIYAYDIQFHPMAGKCYIIRCKRGNEFIEWLDSWGNVVNGWEWLQPIN